MNGHRPVPSGAADKAGMPMTDHIGRTADLRWPHHRGLTLKEEPNTEIVNVAPSYPPSG